MGNRSWEFDMWMLNKGWLLSQEKLNSEFWLYWPTAFLNVHNFEQKKKTSYQKFHGFPPHDLFLGSEILDTCMDYFNVPCKCATMGNLAVTFL